MRRALAPGLILALALAACSTGAGDGGPTAESPTGATATSAPSGFCRLLVALDDELRLVRSYDDRTGTVRRYTRAIASLDLAFRAMRDAAPGDADLRPIEYANGRFGEIVRAMPPDLEPALARAQVSINLESYNAAVFRTLVAGCGPESVDA